MRARGCYPNDIALLCAELRSVSALYDRSFIVPRVVSHLCHASQCVEANLDPSSFRLRHVNQDCQSGPVAVVNASLGNCIENDVIPVFDIVPSSDMKHVSINMRARTARESFIAISHVWAAILTNFR